MTEIRGRVRESVDGLNRPTSVARSKAEERRQEHLRQMAEQRKQEQKDKGK